MGCWNSDVLRLTPASTLGYEQRVAKVKACSARGCCFCRTGIHSTRVNGQTVIHMNTNPITRESKP